MKLYFCTLGLLIFTHLALASEEKSKRPDLDFKKGRDSEENFCNAQKEYKLLGFGEYTGCTINRNGLKHTDPKMSAQRCDSYCDELNMANAGASAPKVIPQTRLPHAAK